MSIRKILLVLGIFSLLILCGCTSHKTYDGYTQIIFELEGGKYKNSIEPIKQYYNFKEGKTYKISVPDNFTSVNKITKSGYELEGWYKTKIDNDGVITYEDKWDFDNDRVTTEGITLYAKWDKLIKFTYDVCYYDDNGEIVKLGSYEVGKDEVFEDYRKFAKKRLGYTPIEYEDVNGNSWDFEYKHPGDEKNPNVKVIVNFIKGDYKVVRTASDLKAYKNYNIYLACDIDLNGANFYFGDYKGSIIGNGFTISNFNLDYRAGKNDLVNDFTDDSKQSLYISLFGNVENSKICDVNFMNVKLNIKTSLSITYKIYVSPLCVTMTNSEIKNVTINGNYVVTELPEGFDQNESLVFVSGDYYRKDDTSSTSNNVINFSKEGEK